MDDVKTPDEKTRKTITMTHKQAGLSVAGLSGAIVLITQLNGMYFPRSEAKALTVQVSELKEIVKDGFKSQTEALVAHTTEESHKHERIVDNYRKEIGDEKADRLRGDELESKRVDLVLELFKLKHSKTN